MLKFLFTFVLIYLAICLFMYLMQRNLLYFPTSESRSELAPVIWVNSGQDRIKVWQLGNQKPAIIYFGGNAEAVENNIADFNSLFSTHTVYLVNYRGYGGSSGSPSEQALFEDALSVYNAIKSEHGSISVMGRSLGSGVAVYLATKREIERLVLVTPYDSIKNVAKSHYPVLPVSWLLKDHFDSISRSEDITQPVLILQAENDLVVPRKHTEQLSKSLTHIPLENVVIAGSSHNDISSFREYKSKLVEFIQ